MNILIVEDDAFLAERIRKVFAERVVSNRIRIVRSFLEFVNEAPIVGSYDIVLTDLKLSDEPGGEPEGYRVIRTIREKNVDVPVVVISAYSEVERLRTAFEYGASDYIIKPVRLKELEIRVLNWFQNYYLSKISFLGRRYRYHDLEFDLDANEFFFGGRRLPLTKHGKYLLSVFFSHPEKLLRESFLAEKIWGDTAFRSDRNLRVNVLRLKRALCPFGIEGWIRNVRGEGYVFSRAETGTVGHYSST